MGDLVAGEAQLLARKFLFAGLLEELVRRADAQELRRASTPLSAAHSVTAEPKPPIFECSSQVSDKRELPESASARHASSSGFTVWKETTRFEASARRYGQACFAGLDRLGKHVAGREDADFGALGDGDRFADLEVARATPLCTTGSPFLPMRM